MRLTNRWYWALTALCVLAIVGILGGAVAWSYYARQYETKPTAEGCVDVQTVRPWDNKVMAHHVVCGRP